MSKETFYFSHDYNARNDPKIQRMFMKMGFAGKGLYWDIIEMLYENEGRLMLSDIETYAFALRAQTESITQLIHDFDLFVIDGGSFYSRSVLQRLEKRNEKRAKATASANARWNKGTKPGKNANASRPQSEGNAIKESKGKEIKEDNILSIVPSEEDAFDPSKFSNAPDLKPFNPGIPAEYDNPFQRQKKEFLDVVRLTDKEHETLVTKHGYDKTEWMIERLNNYKMSKGYNWNESDYHTILSWVVSAAAKEFKPAEKKVNTKGLSIRDRAAAQQKTK